MPLSSLRIEIEWFHSRNVKRNIFKTELIREKSSQKSSYHRQQTKFNGRLRTFDDLYAKTRDKITKIWISDRWNGESQRIQPKKDLDRHKMFVIYPKRTWIMSIKNTSKSSTIKSIKIRYEWPSFPSRYGHRWSIPSLAIWLTQSYRSRRLPLILLLISSIIKTISISDAIIRIYPFQSTRGMLKLEWDIPYVIRLL